MSSWESVFSSEQAYRVEIVKALLGEHNINAVIVNKRDTAYHIGLLEVYVASKDVLKATKIIRNDLHFE
ncbi:MAG: DUF2007 domain-containing protein [Cytophagales bacterium]|nr:DUF2007 domain-containing protein [Cytophagales bacterium]